jgi:hypothetical protein
MQEIVRVSETLMRAACEIEAKLDSVEAGEWQAMHVALLASALYEALRTERASACSVEKRFLLDGLIARCRRSADDAEELASMISGLLGRTVPKRASPGMPGLRVIRGGIAAL